MTCAERAFFASEGTAAARAACEALSGRRSIARLCENSLRPAVQWDQVASVHVEILGSPGTAVMGYRYKRAREPPCEMIVAQVHGGSRYGQHDSGSAELVRCTHSLDAENRAGALAHPR